MTIFAVFTLTLQKPRMPQIQGVKGALQQRAHSPARFIGTEGLASESENVTVPYSGSFSAACCRELQPVVIYREPSTTKEMRYHRFSQRVNNVAIFLSFWMSLPVNSLFTENIVHN